MTTSCPSCNDRERLLWYAAGALPPEESMEVERALESCQACRSAASENAILARAVRVDAFDEPSPEELLRLAETASPEPELQRLSELDREVISVLRRVDEDLRAREASWRGWLERWRARLAARDDSWTLIANPAWAYLIVLALAYPAYLGITNRTDERAPSVLAEPYVLGDEARTGTPGAARIEREGSDTVVTVFVPIDEALRYDLAILDSTGSVVFRREDARSFDGIGTFAVLLPAGTLPSGPYEIRVSERTRTGDSELVSAYRFPFVLE